MKTQTNLTVAKLRKFLLVTALVICPFLALQSGNAQVATATLTSGGMTSISITQGGSFTLTLGITTNFISSGYTVFYQAGNAAGASGFRLLSRVNLSPINGVTGTNVFSDPTTSDSVAFGGLNNGGFLTGTVPRSNQFDLGYTGDQTNNQAAGTFTLQSVTIMAFMNLAPGVYTFGLDSRSIMTQAGTFMDINMGGNPIFTVTVTAIPEPATVGLFVVGGALLLVFAWRRQRAQA